ncbi:MAG: SDR family oxidoreductase [Pseudomonadota bacterium]
MNFDQNVVVITGAARGLGRVYAEAFAAEGAHIVVGDLRDCSETVDALRAAGTAAEGARTDVTSAESCAALASIATERFGRIDVLVNNAALYGSLKFAPFEQLDDAEWDRVMAVNVKGLWHMCRAVMPAMRKQQSGSIVNVSSLAATYGMPNGLHYTTSKAAVIGFTRGLAREVGRWGVRVNTVAPNVVNTEATAEVFGDKRDKVVTATQSQQAIRRALEPEDIVGTVVYLAGAQSRMTTGQTVMVDGGTVLL